MIDVEKLKPVLEGYKAYFPVHWNDEMYKWEAVKYFQDHWDIEAENFGDMFKQATDKTFNLLASGYACMFNMGGNQIGAKTLDLNVDFKVIAAQLDKIANDYFQQEVA